MPDNHRWNVLDNGKSAANYHDLYTFHIEFARKEGTISRIKEISLENWMILEDVIYVDGEYFHRFYYHGLKPTRYFASKSGKVYSEISDVIMSPSLNGNGYETLGLRFENKGHPKYFGVHVIVATTFHGWYKGLVIDHIDGNPRNNHADNLEWVTFAENVQRAYDNNLHKKYYGDDNSSTKYSDSIIHEACKLLELGYSRKDVVKITGVSKHAIDHVISGKTRKDISSMYKFPSELFSGPKHPLSDKIKEQIREMRIQNIEFKEIQKILGIESLSRVYHAIYDDKYKNRDISSTTIPQEHTAQ